MDIQTQQAGPVCSIALRGELDIYAAAIVREQLIPLLTEHPMVELQLAEVNEIDTAGVQLLLAAKQMASKAGHTFKLAGHSRAVIDALELCGLLPYFGDPVVEFDQRSATAAQEAA